jgi:hypothetical protein
VIGYQGFSTGAATTMERAACLAMETVPWHANAGATAAFLKQKAPLIGCPGNAAPPGWLCTDWRVGSSWVRKRRQ